MRRSALTLATSLAAVLALAACGGGTPAPPAGAGPAAGSAAPAGGPLDLTGVCPATVVVQEDWQPEAEHGGVYSLVGKDRTIDAAGKLVRGPLVAHGVDTGVKIEVRPGGPNVGFQPTPALLALDPSIVLAAVNSDAAIAAGPKQPTVAVVSQLTASPMMFMWDPASHPGAQTLKDVTKSGAPVLTSDKTITALLVAQGLVAANQVDGSFEGTPARFVADPKVIQQGFVTSEPYTYAHELSQWNKPVSYERLADYGYTVYPSPMAVRADRLKDLTPCLKKLVPILQQAQIDFLANPGPTNALIVDLVNAYQTGWTYSAGVADYSVKTMREQHLVYNDPASGVFGQFDPARMKQIVDTFGPILQQQGAITASPDPSTLYTNDFIDPKIKMS